jgi:N-acetylglucosaminyldiphosphoundecaprenol N-acetyl-beta-D-mannosaminyltransferase
MTLPSTSDLTTVVGVPVHSVTMHQLVDTLLRWTTSGLAESAQPNARLPRVVIGVNAHVCNLSATDATYRRELLAADLTYADGQSVVWAARVLGRHLPERIATTDLIYPLAVAAAQTGKKLFLFGGKPGVAAEAARRLEQLTPGLQTAEHHGYVTHAEENALLDEINLSQAQILCVGLGDPLQLMWIARNRHRLFVPVILTCGGLFDWTSGANRRAPAWLISVGCEWLWRLMIEPKRLAKRYLLGNPAFVLRLGQQLLALRGGPHKDRFSRPTAGTVAAPSTDQHGLPR